MICRKTILPLFALIHWVHEGYSAPQGPVPPPQGQQYNPNAYQPQQLPPGQRPQLGAQYGQQMQPGQQPPMNDLNLAMAHPVPGQPFGQDIHTHLTPEQQERILEGVNERVPDIVNKVVSRVEEIEAQEAMNQRMEMELKQSHLKVEQPPQPYDHQIPHQNPPEYGQGQKDFDVAPDPDALTDAAAKQVAPLWLSGILIMACTCMN